MDHIKNNLLQKTAKINIDNVAEYYWLNEQEIYDFSKDIPYAKLPFDHCTFQYSPPKLAKINGLVQNSLFANTKVTVMAYEFDDSEKVFNMFNNVATVVQKFGDSVNAIKKIFNEAEDKQGKLCWTILALIIHNRIQGFMYYGVNDGGQVPEEAKCKGVIALPSPYLKQNGESIESIMADTRDLIYVFCTPVMLSVSFMHCKNVKRIENDPNIELSRQVKRQMQRKNQPPLDKYYTLEIEPMKEVLRKEGGIEHNGLKKALHICRGHFVHYDEKPLFGKYKGTFWKPAHVRGGTEVGQIHKDYSVKV